MTREEANKFLNELKDGTRYASIEHTRRALVATGDLQEDAGTPDLAGEHERRAQIRVAQSEATGR